MQSKRGEEEEPRRPRLLHESSSTGQIKTTAEQVIKEEIMNSIILFSVERWCRVVLTGQSGAGMGTGGAR